MTRIMDLLVWIIAFLCDLFRLILFILAHIIYSIQDNIKILIIRIKYEIYGEISINKRKIIPWMDEYDKAGNLIIKEDEYVTEEEDLRSNSLSRYYQIEAECYWLKMIIINLWEKLPEIWKFNSNEIFGDILLVFLIIYIILQYI
jgi:hypothetical protein